MIDGFGASLPSSPAAVSVPPSSPAVGSSATANPPARLSGDLAGQCALITGAREGIGLACAEALGLRGARVLLGGRAAARLAPAVEALRARGIDAAAFVADVTDTDALNEAFAAAAADGDVPRILVNNVGVRDRRGVATLDTASFGALIGADLVAVYDVIRHFLSGHVEPAGASASGAAGSASAAGASADGPGVPARGGSIVNISSVAAQRGRAGDVGYAAAKAGIEGMTRSLATELGPLGYRVNAVAPGTVDTPSNAALMTDPRMSEVVRTRTALQRWGRPSEIAEAVSFLAGPQASYITGQSRVVDCGLSTLF